ncbi:MAG: response regulator [Pseudobacteriovorax sp.]|nr:response regulator [Pseudobacteriovorax sp.]
MESMTTAEFEGVSIFAIDGEGEVSIIVSKPGPIDYRAESFPLTIKNKQLSYHATFPISESRGKAYYVTLIKPIDTTLIFTWILATLFVTSLIIFFIGYILKLISRNFSRAIEDVVTQIRKFDDVAIPSFRYTESEDLYLKFESQWSQLKDKERQLQDHNKFKAIASTTQMLAHDVRKPFSMVRALVDCLKGASSLKETNEILGDTLPSIESAIVSVNGMIADVMQVGSDAKLTPQPVAISEIISNCTKYAFQFDDQINIDIHMDFHHSYFVDVDPRKVERVIANILGNAIEHMNGSGKIWFVTKELKNRLFLTIGNSNTFIPPSEIGKLFDAFYTKDKSGGTGLGLAIAKKITEAHGGQISCTSSLEIGTEFTIDLPLANEKDYSTFTKVQHSTDFLMATKSKLLEEKTDPNLKISLHKPIQVALLDDEQVYLRALSSAIKDIDSKSSIKVKTYMAAEDLISEHSKYDLLVIDIDLHDTKRDGIQLTKELRENGFEGLICIHSDRDPVVYQSMAFEAGANLYFSKPLSKGQLITVLGAVDSKKSEKTSSKILLFEDERIFQRQWLKQLGEKNVHCYTSLDDFIHNPPISDMCEFEYIVCDYYLANDSTGVEVALHLKKIGARQKIFLSSDAENLSADELGLFDGVISKDPKVSLELIRNDLQSSQK